MSQPSTFISKDLTDAVITAIQMEDEGYSIYMESADKTANILGKKTFLAIAEKEKMHKKTIEEFYSQLTGTPDAIITFKGDTQWSGKLRTEVLKGIKEDLDKAYDADAPLTKAYEITMDLETKGYEFYKSISAGTDNEDAKKLFEFLAKEESLHYEILQETLLYLAKPAEWFNKEEKWLVEG